MCFLIFNLFSFFFEQFQHGLLLIVLDLKNFSQGLEVIVLLLGEVYLETWQIDVQDLFVFGTITLVGYHEVHVAYDRVNALTHAAVLQGVALFHEGVVPEEGRTDNHWELLVISCSFAIDVEAAEVQAPAFLLIERADEDRAVDVEVDIHNFFELKVFCCVILLLMMQVVDGFEMCCFDYLIFFEAEKFLELLHVESFIDDCYFFDVAADGLFEHCVLLQQLIFID